jgi:putative SOS response-associated peptidase YedK
MCTEKRPRCVRSADVSKIPFLTVGANASTADIPRRDNRRDGPFADFDWPKWLGEEQATEEELLAMLKPCADGALKIWPVDKMVGNVRNKGPQLAMPL